MAKNNNSEENVMLSQKDVFDILEFANAVRYTNNVYTPQIVNDALKQLNINTLEPDETKLTQALGNPMPMKIILSHIVNFIT